LSLFLQNYTVNLHEQAKICSHQVGKYLNWRAAFWGESILMVPFVILGFVIKPLNLKGIAFSSACFLFHKKTILVCTTNYSLESIIL
jgi:hypothetical protein